MDVGSFKAQAGGVSAEYQGGLVRLDYSIAIFDVASGERLLYRDVVQLPIMYRLFHDPRVVNDPTYKDRIQVRESASGSSGNYRSDLSTEETIEIAMKYVREELSKFVP